LFALLNLILYTFYALILANARKLGVDVINAVEVYILVFVFKL